MVSPLGAIGNGIELLTLGDFGERAELQLVQNSVNLANARLRFFRIAFGSSKPGPGPSAGELNGALEALTLEGRFAVDWKMPEGTDRATVQLCFLAILCLQTAMPRGGHISAASFGDTRAVSGESDVVVQDPAVWSLLSDNSSTAHPTSAEIQFLILRLYLEDKGLTPVVDADDSHIRIRF